MNSDCFIVFINIIVLIIIINISVDESIRINEVQNR